MLISTRSYNVIPLRTAFSQFFTFLLLSSHLLNVMVCIIKSFLCHDIKQAMSYHIMEFYVTTCHISQLSRHPYRIVGYIGGLVILRVINCISVTYRIVGYIGGLVILRVINCISVTYRIVGYIGGLVILRVINCTNQA